MFIYITSKFSLIKFIFIGAGGFFNEGFLKFDLEETNDNFSIKKIKKKRKLQKIKDLEET